MKKFFFIIIFASVFHSGFSQQLKEPVNVAFNIELQEILRINITSGGNIEFLFTNMDKYKVGILNSAFYNTTVQVASSTDWQLSFGADGITFFGTDDVGHTMFLDNVGYKITPQNPLTLGSAVANGTLLNNLSDAAPQGLVVFPFVLMSPVGTGNAGDATDSWNNFTFNWECATVALRASTLEPSILDQGLQADRYVTTVYLEIEPQ